MSVLEITIQRKVADYYPVVAKYSSDPDKPVEFSPVCSKGEFQISQADIEHLLSLLGQSRAYGAFLGKLLFKESIGDAFASARARSPEHLRLLLFLKTEAPELQTLRWERLCARGDGNQWNLLRLNQRIPYSIYVPSLVDRRFPPIGRYGLKALVLVSSPENSEEFGLATFDIQETVASVRASLGNIDCDVLADVDGAVGLPTLENLLTHLTKENYTFLHVVCHGRRINEINDVVLFLSNDIKQVAPVEGKVLIKKLKAIEGLPHFTFLCTCESAKVDEDGAFGGFAGQLIRDLGMPAVVAMTEKISVRTAEGLVQAFYQQLIKHGEVDLALDQATASVSSHDDVLVPALFSCLGGRPLFSDSLNRPLTPQEIHHGLERLQGLLKERAPILTKEFIAQQKILSTEQDEAVEISILNQPAREQAQHALDELNKISGEVLGISFNAVALDKKVSQYESRCPFPGLKPFTPKDKVFFFERDALAERLKIELERVSFLVLTGVSGSGKSSLVLAGLVPVLQEEQPGLKLVYIDIGSAHNPLQQLKASLAAVKNQPFILVLDAFEALSIPSRTSAQQKEWIEILLAVVDSHQPQPKVILTMRRDCFTEHAHDAGLASREISVEYIKPMTTTALRLAMEQQAARAGLKFDVGLSNTILENIEKEPGSMPLLQHVLNALWKRRHGQWLLESEYQKIGGVKQAIADIADNFYNRLPEEDKARMKNIFIRLTRIDPDAKTGRNSRDTRHRVALSELVLAKGERQGVLSKSALSEGDLGKTQALVDALAGDTARLVCLGVPDEDANETLSRHQQYVEMAHEALIDSWPRLKQWLEEHRSEYQRREEIRKGARRWKANKLRDDDLISNSKELEAFKGLERLGFLNDAEKDYVEASQQAQLRRAKRNTVIATIVTTLLFCLSVIAVVMSYQADQNRKDANKQKKNVELKEQAARASSWISEGKSAPGLLLSLDTLSKSLGNSTTELDAQESVIDAVQRAREEKVLEGHQGSVRAIAYDPKNGYIVTGGEDNSLKLWNAKTGQLLASRDKAHDGAIYSIAFSPNGTHLVSGGKDKILKIWTIDPIDDNDPFNSQDTGQIKLSLRNAIQGGHTQSIRTVAFSPDGNSFVSASDDQTLRLWNVNSGQPISKEPMRGHRSMVWSVAFSPDGKQIASGSVDRMIKVWDGKTGDLAFTIPSAHEDTVFSVAFSSDSQRIVSGSGDRSIRIWKAETGERIGFPLLGHDGKIYSVAFTPNNQVVSTGSDRTIRFWHPETATEIDKIVEAHSSLIWALALVHDGKKLVSIGSDEKVRLWDINNDLPLGQSQRTLHTKDILSIAIHPRGKQIVSVGEDTRLMVWDGPSQKLLWQIPNIHDAPVQSVAFSPTEEKFVTASSDGTLKLWDATVHKNAIWRTDSNPNLTRGQRDIYTATFTPDGKTIVSGGRDGKIRLWDVSNGQQLVEWIASNAKEPIFSVAVDPDGKYIASAGADETITLLDRQTGELIQRFRGHEQDIWSIAFSPNGELLVSGSKDDTVRLWQRETGEQIGTPLEGHTHDVSTVAFSPTGRLIASASFDKTIRLWDVSNHGDVKLSGSPFTGHLESIWSIQFMPDGKSIVSASADLSLRRWPSHWSQWPEIGCTRLAKHPLMLEPQESSNIDNDLVKISKDARAACEGKVWLTEGN